MLAGNGYLHYHRHEKKQSGVTVVSLAITAKGQVTLKREVLAHLGVQPGERIECDMLPNGELRIRARKATGHIEALIGLLAGRTSEPLTIEDMNDLIAAGWAGER